MPFNTYTFILFFLLVLFIHTLLKNWRCQKLNLLIASYIFYSAWNPLFVLLLFFSTICDWLLAAKIYEASTYKLKKAYLALSICLNLGLLGYFKYGDFFLESFISWLAFLGIYFEPAALNIVLPVGISFYTFQTLSYTIDVYRGKIRPEPVFLNYALYVSFFPQLVAGPIVRAGDFLPQCEKPRHANKDQFGWGISLLVIGLFMKVVIADTLLAPIVDKLYENPTSFGNLETWVAVLSFSGQIFCDFGGYSTCAIGAALCLGFILPDNFKAPYAAIGFQDFWRRWHISLSSWLKDYLYVGLGGNRVSVSRTNVNIILTMLIGGLWHGASWLFVLWGGLHGCYLIIERVLKNYLPTTVGLSRAVELNLIVITYLVASLTWVFFRAPDFNSALIVFANLIPDAHSIQTGVTLTMREINIGLTIPLLLLAWHIYRRNSSLEGFFSKIPPYLRSLLLFSQLLILYLFATGDDRAFIYFQF